MKYFPKQHVFQSDLETRTETATHPPKQPPTNHPEASFPTRRHNKPKVHLLGTMEQRVTSTFRAPGIVEDKKNRSHS